MRGRLIAIGVLALSLAPGTWLRDDSSREQSDTVRFTRLDIAKPSEWPDALSLMEVWELDGANSAFSGFSAMVPARRGASFRLFSDKGNTALIPRPRSDVTLKISTLEVSFDSVITDSADIEAAVVDPASDTLWLAYEHHNAVRRFAVDGTSTTALPAQMQGWSKNSGAEAMTRLPDGRFVMLAERGEIGLLFDGDPVEGGQAAQFRFDPPGDFRPTAMALLPDGRMLILLREIRWQVPPFASMLVIADPAAIRGGEEWAYGQLVTFDQPDLRDNYEAMLVEPDGRNAAIIWLISDDNQSILQRTLLLKLRWEFDQQTQTAREAQTSGPLSSD